MTKQQSKAIEATFYYLLRVERSACLDQRSADEGNPCICHACEAKKLIAQLERANFDPFLVTPSV